MAFEQAWEQTHKERQWGSYPKEELVRWASSVGKRLTVLDLGAGAGASTWFLAREGHRPIAVDGSISALRNARARLTIEGYHFTGAQCHFMDLPFADQAFDACVDVVSVAHNTFAEIYGIFKEVARVLKPRGKLFTILPSNRCSRRPFQHFITTFFERDEVNYILADNFANIQIFSSSYQVALDTRVDTWVVSAEKGAKNGSTNRPDAAITGAEESWGYRKPTNAQPADGPKPDAGKSTDADAKSADAEPNDE